MVLANGLSATRTGYFRMTRYSGRPLTLADTTYGLRFSSSRLARMIRICAAVAAIPNTIAGMGMWANKSWTFAQDHGASANSGLNKPPMFALKYLNPK